MKQLLLINADEILKDSEGYTYLLEHPNVRIIQDKEFVKQSESNVINSDTEVFMFFNKASIDFKSILAFIKANTNTDDFTVIIDASEFDEEDHDALDSVMETLADYVKLLIADDAKDLRRLVIGLISKYL